MEFVLMDPFGQGSYRDVDRKAEEYYERYRVDVYADPPVGAGPPAINEAVPPAPNKSTGGVAMRPDITKAQIIALVGAVLSLFSAFGLDLTQEQRNAILDLAGQLGVALILADAGLRAARNLSDRSPIKP